VGLHSHIGSQIFDTSGFEVAARRVLALYARGLADGLALGELNLGGGFGVDIRNRHRSAVSHQARRDRQPDTARAAGHDRNLAL